MADKYSQSVVELNLVELNEEESSFEIIELNVIVNNILETEEESLVERTGPRVRDYLLSLFEYLRTRLGYILTTFRAPIRLQRVMEQLEFLRMPLELWRSFINASVRMIALSGITFDVETLAETIILIVSIVAEFYINSFFLKAAIAILVYIGPTFLARIITYVYDTFNYIVRKLWEYVKKRLEQFYELSSACIKQYSKPNSR